MYKKYKTDEEKRKKKKKLAIILPLIFLFIAAAVAIPVSIVYTRKQPVSPDPGPTPGPTPTPEPYTGPTFKFDGTKLLGFCDEMTNDLILERFPNGSITIPECSEIESNAFDGKIPDGINEIILPSNTTSIGDCAFANNSFNKLSFYKDKDISNWKLKTIGSKAFYKTNISSLTFPFEIEKIGDECFASCKNLSYIDVLLKANSSSVVLGNKCFDEIAQSGEVIVRLKTTDGWKTSLTEAGIIDETKSFSKYWKITEFSCLDIEDNICYGIKQDIPTYLQFLIQDETKDLIIPSTVEKISNDKGGFQNNQFINKLTIPKSVKEIDKNCFVGCSNLNLIDVTEYNSVPSWSGIDIFESCHDTGQVEVNNNLKVSWKQLFIDQSGLIIDNDHWKVGHDVSCLENCLKVEALADSTMTLTSTTGTTKVLDFQYSTGNDEWIAYTQQVSIPAGSCIYLRGFNSTGWNDPTLSFTASIKFTGQVNLGGSIMGLIGGDLDPPEEIPCENCFKSVFFNNKSIVHVDKNFLPAKKLKKECYKNLFGSCTSLTNAPKLPATELAESCYEAMFSACSSLTEVYDLPNTKMPTKCCYRMFNGCYALVDMPCLPSTDLGESCYNRMFDSCVELKNLKELPATILADYCYAGMFQNCWGFESTPVIKAKQLAVCSCQNMFNACQNLSNVVIEFEQWNDTATKDWLSGTKTEGTFVCPSNLPIPETRSTSNIPEYWEITNN